MQYSMPKTCIYYGRRKHLANKHIRERPKEEEQKKTNDTQLFDHKTMSTTLWRTPRTVQLQVKKDSYHDNVCQKGSYTPAVVKFLKCGEDFFTSV